MTTPIVTGIDRAAGPDVTVRTFYYTVECPWPYKGLNPNDRCSDRATRSARRRYRQDCYSSCLIVGRSVRHHPDATSVHLSIRFDPPNRNRRDRDNAIASFKHGQDGIAGALGVDDYIFSTSYHLSRESVRGGRVVVEIRVQERVSP